MDKSNGEEEVSLKIRALSKFITPRRLERIREVAAKRTRFLTVVLEDIENPFNATAVTRTAEGLGIAEMHIIENHHRFALSAGVTQGAAQWVSMHRHATPGADNSADCLAALSQRGYRLVATSPHRDGYTPDTLPLDRPVAIVFGYEKSGISPEAARRCESHLRLPMYGFVESFNITVSAAIALSRLRERIGVELPDGGIIPPEVQDELVLEWVRASLPRKVLAALPAELRGGSPL